MVNTMVHQELMEHKVHQELMESMVVNGTQGPQGIQGPPGPSGVTFLNGTNLYRVVSANVTTTDWCHNCRNCYFEPRL